ncbi:PapB/FocB family fimbrial expression transcriptional regulator [Citrobacter portucalensis]|uniref:PapB/FocB family fimbrial expression transcriptional regulator n=1 Tax=Citrobacter portucalensis TaxID=1639133 RepID=UPI00288C5D80|nr:PapB/FocB family fimbrial expression transcriptional regulator [Citrobacter portucalensis]WNI84221.1 PapB/FocB family fimbrial expression transcriptional regulator [Citrobacter portucalensis]
MDKLSYLYHHSPGLLRCGEVHPEQFRQLIALSGIHSTRVIMALEDYLVYGVVRKMACEKHGVSTSYMSVSLAKLQQLSRGVATLASWYAKAPELPG